MTMEGTHKLWADLYRPGIAPSEANITVFGVPFDGLASARRGAALAPERIRFWSRHLTPFSEDRIDLRAMNICDLGDFQVVDPRDGFAQIAGMVAGLPGVFVMLGGDHSVSIPVFEGQRRRSAGKRLGVLWVDAHPDLCDEFDGSHLSHACVLRRGLEFGIDPKDVCLIGLRSWEDQEIDLIENGGMHVFTAAEVAELGIKKVAKDVRAVLTGCDAVHISFDIDALDPSAAPGTGIPDFGGLSMRETLTFLKALQGLPFTGMDMVEVAPLLDPSEVTVFAALKIIMEFITMIKRGTNR
ncbi:MAG TPA: agmatinase [Anaerolineales bacterium]|jgi:agmatinase